MAGHAAHHHRRKISAKIIILKIKSIDNLFEFKSQYMKKVICPVGMQSLMNFLGI